jgi:hypothetical protein
MACRTSSSRAGTVACSDLTMPSRSPGPDRAVLCGERRGQGGVAGRGTQTPGPRYPVRAVGSSDAPCPAARCGRVRAAVEADRTGDGSRRIGM